MADISANAVKKLLPGDLVLADHGFDIADSVDSTLHISRKKPQLSATEVE